MSGHTPGPWHECKNGQCICGIIWSIPGDFPVCTVAGGNTFPVAVAHEHMADSPEDIYQSITPAQVVANARLIASAPDLLAALKGLLADIEDYQRINNLGGENNHWQVISRAAIARAEDSHV